MSASVINKNLCFFPAQRSLRMEMPALSIGICCLPRTLLLNSPSPTLEHLFLLSVTLETSLPSSDLLVLQPLPEFLILPSALGVGIFLSFN